MNTPIPIESRDFWDYPRMFLAFYEGRLYLFDCEFDEGLEDFRDDYKIYLMPDISLEDRAGSWVELPRRAIRFLRSVPLAAVPFADPLKKTILSKMLDELAKEQPRRTG